MEDQPGDPAWSGSSAEKKAYIVQTMDEHREYQRERQTGRN